MVRLYDTKSAKASVVVVKVQGEDKTLDLTDENEEDICKHFKVQHGTKEFFKVVLERVSLVLTKEAGLQLQFDWTGIPRLKVLEAERQAKLAERKRQEEEARIAKEKAAEAARQELERQKAEEERKRKEAERRAKEAEELKRKQELERIENEKKEKRKAFENAIMGGLTGTGPKIRHRSAEEEAEAEELAASGITKTWSDEHQEFYYYSEETNELSWRDPRIKSPWEKKWDADNKAFYWKHAETGETLQKEPWSSTHYKVWNNDRRAFDYVSMVDGEVSIKEPEY